MKQKVLFIDDEPNVLHAYRRELHEFRNTWEMAFADCPLAASIRIRNEPWDAIVSDVRMPGMSGLELLVRVKQNVRTNIIPVIIVTGDGDRPLKRQALELGATDLLAKPVDREDLTSRIRNALRLKRQQDQILAANELLEQRVNERTEELAASRLDLLWRLGKAAEFRDEETGNHVIRVGCYSRAIAEGLGLDHEFASNIFLAAPLHDIGKIGIPDSVLLKTNELTDDEWQVMKRHCEMGVAILAHESKLMHMTYHRAAAPGVLPRLTLSNPVLQMASEIAQAHHEYWDGSGYPRGLRGEEIPLAARIVTIADIYDSLRTPRPYKRSYSCEESLEIMESMRWQRFDPEIFPAFQGIFEEIQAIEDEFSDDAEFGGAA